MSGEMQSSWFDVTGHLCTLESGTLTETAPFCQPLMAHAATPSQMGSKWP